MVDVCKKAEDRGASSFMHKPPILYQESLLVTSPLFQVVCLAILLKLDAAEAFIINLWKFAWYVSSMKNGLMSFKKMMEELLVRLTLLWKSYLISSPLKDACLCIVVEYGSIGIFRISALALCSGENRSGI
ncbi:hypothetical protein SO802_031167 [Lithocarpus litseifolius]|uniref:Uncharacterized protein n=1 Tax=Lithocarpus litseifolius TaxID=425828 RepID=A0AAW2BLK7_9ROSI